MPNDITVTKNTTSGSERWDVQYTVDASGTIDKTLDTAGNLLDRNIKVSITTPTDFIGSGITTKSAQTYTPTTSDQIISSGQYLSGNQTISGDSNLIASNIKKNTTIFGVTGTYDGGVSNDPKTVHFIDYDGTIVYEYTTAEINAMSSLPANPTHTGLTAQGWNWTLAEIKAQLLDNPDMPVVVGQIYITSDGTTQIDITLDNPNYLSPYLFLAIKGTVSIDWGDNTTPDIVTGTDIGSTKSVPHIYASTGSYTIKISVTSGNFGFRSTSTSYPIIGIDAMVSSNSNYNTYYASKISAIRIGSNCIRCKYIGNKCLNLEYITIPNGALDDSGGYLVTYNSKIKALILPNKCTNSSTNLVDITYITHFNEYCANLTYVSLPPSISNIGAYSFSYCANLSLITLKNGIVLSGSYALYYCPKLTFPISITGYSSSNKITTPTYLISYCNFKYITLASDVEIINNFTFSYNFLLESIFIPKKVESIGNSCFYYCINLEEVTFESNSSLTTLGNNVFQYCPIQSITLPNTITSMGTGIFSYCRNLFSVTLPNTITTIPASTFYSCNMLNQVIIPNTVTSIGSTAFYNCFSILTITIPSLVDSIAAQAFASCYGLKEIHFKPTTPPVVANSNAFSNIPTTCTIYVPTGYLSAYTTASNYPNPSTYTYVEE